MADTKLEKSYIPPSYILLPKKKCSALQILASCTIDELIFELVIFIDITIISNVLYTSFQSFKPVYPQIDFPDRYPHISIPYEKLVEIN